MKSWKFKILFPVIVITLLIMAKFILWDFPMSSGKRVGNLTKISKKGKGRCVFNLLTFPVLVMVCHWSRTRPVVKINGNSVLGSTDVFSILLGKLNCAFLEGV